MKIAILADDRPGLIPVMAASLRRMLDCCGESAEIFSDGLAILNQGPANALRSRARNAVKYTVNLALPDRFHYQKIATQSSVKRFHENLKSFDLAVVVCPLPNAFLKGQLNQIEKIRAQSNIPIVLYQNYYLGTRPYWARRLLAPGSKDFGLERYDWYLAASVVSEAPLSEVAHPCTMVGHDLRGGDLGVEEKGEFRVLLDFKRRGHESQRELQVQALKATGTPFTQLSGSYTVEEIRQLYRRHSALFLSSSESFGLPIVENQLCGNLVFTPYKNWAPSHYTGKSVHEAGEGNLGSNFRIYDNELETLEAQIARSRADYCPKTNLSRFMLEYPHLYCGDLAALELFLAKIKNREINGNSHLDFAVFNERIKEDFNI